MPRRHSYLLEMHEHGSLTLLLNSSGKGVGSVAGGQVFEEYGAVVTFRSCAVMTAISLVLFWLVQRWGDTNKEEPKEEETKGEVDKGGC